jgi:uncharacterized protein
MRRRVSALATLALLLSTLPALGAAADDTPVGPRVVISQVYGGGGNSGALYRHDFVELFNQGDQTQDLTGWSVQYASQAGTSWSPTVLSGTIAPGQRYLIQMAAGANTAAEPLPTPDATGTTNMSGTNAKVALVSSTTALPTGTCPTGDTLVDAVGYGSTGCADIAITGTTNLGNNSSALRDEARCADTFTIVSPPQPENTTAPLTPCTEPVGPPSEPIAASCTDLSVSRGEGGSVTLSATDPDGTVTDATITDGATDGIALADTVPAGGIGGELTVELTADDTLRARDYPVEVTFSNDDPTPQTATCTATVRVFLELPDDVCETPDGEFTAIHEIQGSGASSPIAGEFVATRGVVTANFASGGATGLPNNQGLRGYFIEAIEADRDEDPSTSEGVFVFDFDGLFDGQVGDLVHVAGQVGEFTTVTQVSSGNMAVCDTGLDTDLPPPAELPLPLAPEDREGTFRSLESMRVVHTELTLVEFFQLERYGTLRLSSGGVFDNPTNVVSPHDDAAYQAIVDFNAANNIYLDDGRSAENSNRLPLGEVAPLPFLQPGDTLRIGDQLLEQDFVLHYGRVNQFASDLQWKLQPIDVDQVAEELQKGRTRPRPSTPPDVDGDLLVASYNVLNYFDGDGQGGGFPTARGARTPSELDRQTEKLVAAITKIDADVVGLIEMENDGGEGDGAEEFQATATLVDALNEEYGEEVYDFIDTGKIGTDAIKQAFIYKPSTVAPTGDYAILDSSVDERFDDRRSRPALAQTFTELATGEAITVTVNHLKSKGSACDPEDNDPRQGNCNGVRVRAAQAIADWMNDDPTGEEAVGNLIIGDINAYAEEDPITEILDRGYIDMLKVFAPEGGPVPYSYTFDATQGRLDHALADEDLAPFVTGADEWHINADETQAIDYQEGPGNFRTDEVGELYYQPNEFRSSDHDPVLVGLRLNEPPTVEDLTLTTRVNRPVTGQIVADDPDGDPLTYTFGEPTNGSVTPGEDGAFTYTPRRAFRGTDAFEVTVDDGRGGRATGTVTVRVVPGNSAAAGPPEGDGPPGLVRQAI